jgi:hypothetical protein
MWVFIHIGGTVGRYERLQCISMVFVLSCGASVISTGSITQFIYAISLYSVKMDNGGIHCT